MVYTLELVKKHKPSRIIGSTHFCEMRITPFSFLYLSLNLLGDTKFLQALNLAQSSSFTLANWLIKIAKSIPCTIVGTAVL